MSRIRNAVAPYTAELVGTFLFTLIGIGANAQLAVTNSIDDAGYELFRALAWGLGLTLAIFVSKYASGGHVNPAITVTEATHSGLPFSRLVGHILAQLAGAFVAAFVVWINYGSLFSRISAFPDEGLDAAARIFATYPAPSVGFWHGAFTEMLGTFLLALGTHAINDQNNPQAEIISPLAIGLLFSTIGLGIGYPTGYALNPARDLAPRIFSAFLYGGRVFTVHYWYWLVPAIAPFVGGSLGAGFYHVFVKTGEDFHHHLPTAEDNA